MATTLIKSAYKPHLDPFKGRYLGFPLTLAPSPRQEGKGKSQYLSPSLFTGEGFGVGDTSIKSKIPIPNSTLDPGLELVPCDLCSAIDAAPHLKVKDRIYDLPGEFQLVKCGYCGLI